MNVKAMRNWVAALRSGKYKHTKGAFAYVDGVPHYGLRREKLRRTADICYCVLGVGSACTLPRRPLAELMSCIDGTACAGGSELAPRVARRLGIARYQPRLMELNDGGLSQKELANRIEDDIERYLLNQPTEYVRLESFSQ